MSLQTFHTEFDEHEVSLTALLVDGKPWFKGVEAAAALGYKKPRNAVNAHVDNEEKNALEYLRGPILGPPQTATREPLCTFLKVAFIR